MSILWCGGEPTDIVTNGVITTAGIPYFDSNYSRCAIGINANTIYIDSPVLDTPLTSLWMHVHIYFTAWNKSTTPWNTFGFRDSSTGAFIGVGVAAYDSNNGFRFITWDGGSTRNELYASGENLMIGASRATYDLQVSNYGSNGTINLFQNGSLLGSYTGDLTISGATALDKINIGSGSTSYFSGYISQMILADEDTRGMSLKTLAPNAAGDQNQWSGAYTDVDDITLNDDDYIYTDAAAQNIQLGLTGMPTGTEKLVRQVKVTSRIAQPTGGLGIKQGVKTNSVIHLGSEITPSVGFEDYSEVFNQNPETSQDWTAADIESLQIALQSQ